MLFAFTSLSDPMTPFTSCCIRASFPLETRVVLFGNRRVDADKIWVDSAQPNMSSVMWLLPLDRRPIDLFLYLIFLSVSVASVAVGSVTRMHRASTHQCPVLIACKQSSTLDSAQEAHVFPSE